MDCSTSPGNKIHKASGHWDLINYIPISLWVTIFDDNVRSRVMALAQQLRNSQRRSTKTGVKSKFSSSIWSKVEQYSTPNVLTNHQCTIGILDVIFYNNVKSYQCHPHRESSTNTFVGTPDISFSSIFSCILGGQSMSLSVRRTSTPSCFTGTSFPDESKSRFNSLQSMDNIVLLQTSPCGEVWFEIWLKAHGKFFKAHGKIWNHTRRRHHDHLAQSVL